MKTTVLYRGRYYEIHTVINRGRSEVMSFIDTLSRDDQKKVVALVCRTADHGTLRNQEKFRKLRDGIWEFKSFQIRVLCFFGRGRLIVLTHGFIKKRSKTPDSEINRAIELRKEYLATEKRMMQ